MVARVSSRRRSLMGFGDRDGSLVIPDDIGFQSCSYSWFFRKTEYEYEYETEKSLRQIILLRILLHHPRRRELRHERDHRAADALDPLARDPLPVPLVEERDHFLGQRLEQVRA